MVLEMSEHTSSIPPLPAFDDITLDASFSVLIDEVRASAAQQDPEAFRLLWLGRKAGRLKVLSENWLKAAPPEARKPLGMRFNTLKQQIEAALEADSQPLSKPRTPDLDITLPGTARIPGTPHPLLETMNRVVEVFHQLGYSTQLGPQVETDFYNFEAPQLPRKPPRPRHPGHAPDRRAIS